MNIEEILSLIEGEGSSQNETATAQLSGIQEASVEKTTESLPNDTDSLFCVETNFESDPYCSNEDAREETVDSTLNNSGLGTLCKILSFLGPYDNLTESEKFSIWMLTEVLSRTPRAESIRWIKAVQNPLFSQFPRSPTTWVKLEERLCKSLQSPILKREKIRFHDEFEDVKEISIGFPLLQALTDRPLYSCRVDKVFIFNSSLVSDGSELAFPAKQDR